MCALQGDGLAMSFELVTTFRVFGEPKGQPRARHTKMGHIYTPSSGAGFRSAIQDAAMEAGLYNRGLSSALRVDERFFFPTPKRLERASLRGPIPHMSKPDRDNCDKLLLDALTQIGVWKDDALVSAGVIEKWYASPSIQPGVEVTIYEWVE
jgi:Holliday junction resolvase RusA-like endonuclease